MSPILLFLRTSIYMRTLIFWLYTLSGILVLSACTSSAEKRHQAETSKTILPSSGVVFRPLSPKELNYYQRAAKAYYQTHLLKTGFNGSILVAKNGQIVFEDYHGLINFKTKDSITPSTPFHIASTSKTFTGMTVLRLWEQGRLSLNDSLQKYFPQLPYHGITVKMLLDHRSGLPNYLYFMDSIWNKKVKATNQDVLEFMIQHKPKVMALPDRSFHYCNTNFVLLALIVEKITNQPFPQYMKDSVFTPLGMSDTYIFSVKDTANYIPTYRGRRPYPMDHLDCTYGDKNVYSTVRDLFKWDKALYENTFINKATLDSALVPRSNEHHSMHNYGLAWRLYYNNGDTIVYHNGKWHGTNTSFTRLVQDTATIIVLGNKYNSNIYQAKKMASIFTGKTDDNNLEE